MQASGIATEPGEVNDMPGMEDQVVQHQRDESRGSGGDHWSARPAGLPGPGMPPAEPREPMWDHQQEGAEMRRRLRRLERAVMSVVDFIESGNNMEGEIDLPEGFREAGRMFQ